MLEINGKNDTLQTFVFGLRFCDQQSKSVVFAGMKSGCSNNVLDHVHLFVGIPQIPQISCNGFRSLNSETKWSLQTCFCSKTPAWKVEVSQF